LDKHQGFESIKGNLELPSCYQLLRTHTSSNQEPVVVLACSSTRPQVHGLAS
jgi:hypothetical protein